MTIAIVSIVAPKMRALDARALTSDVRYVRHLVYLMEQNLNLFRSANGPRAGDSLYTLKFTLSALWNLTDECSATCREFFRAEGVQASFQILKTKVLGILVREYFQKLYIFLKIPTLTVLLIIIFSETDLIGAQLWCLWGVNHVLSHSDKNSAAMG
uniref:ArAE_2_N domain-containing protein n=1 Tax=Heterorhabditis bacteriophora TaxID=37862 RepID=A0A1I7WXK4_HETBA